MRNPAYLDGRFGLRARSLGTWAATADGVITRPGRSSSKFGPD